MSSHKISSGEREERDTTRLTGTCSFKYSSSSYEVGNIRDEGVLNGRPYGFIERVVSFFSYNGGRLVDLDDAANGCEGPAIGGGESGRSDGADGLGDDDGEESIGPNDGDDGGDGEKENGSSSAIVCVPVTTGYSEWGVCRALSAAHYQSLT